MQVGRCPNCHTRLTLEQLCQDEAGRELTKLLFSFDVPVRSALASYLGLFRSANRDLSNDRALKLLHETMEIGDPRMLLPALQGTVESMRTKREAGTVKPLANHNYLKAVVASNTGAVVPLAPAVSGSVSANNYRSAEASVERLKDTSW
ncbi:hypothetical protein [Oceanobacter kriegii]|uniref:hypothetical protein n=1 Tax=Oceanobacter kriegii TaxID=64972 RepID=UPI00041B5C14|nr:hypothetical protein [Oceanobacter kriegii]